jgi:hypothetical protein
MRRPIYDKRHLLSFFQGCFQVLLDLVNPDCEASATPLKAEAKAAPTGRQLRLDGHAVVPQRQSSETKHRR